MNSKILSAISALAVVLLATASSSFAATFTPAQFKAGLTQAIGTKKGAAASRAAAAFYKKALADKKNKKFVLTYTNMVVVALKKPVSTALQVQARTALADALAKGYFSKLAYNPQDSKFAASLKKLILSLPPPLKTASAAQLIAAPVISFNNSMNGGATGINFINQTIYNAAGQQPPPPVS